MRLGRSLAACGVGLFLVSGCGREFSTRPFDPASWRAEGERRGEMVDDLLAEHLSVGMSRADVERLLGRPDAVYPGLTRNDAMTLYQIGWYYETEGEDLTLQYQRGSLRTIILPWRDLSDPPQVTQITEPLREIRRP
jgi:hypothetical protein